MYLQQYQTVAWMEQKKSYSKFKDGDILKNDMFTKKGAYQKISVTYSLSNLIPSINVDNMKSTDKEK